MLAISFNWNILLTYGYVAHSFTVSCFALMSTLPIKSLLETQCKTTTHVNSAISEPHCLASWFLIAQSTHVLCMGVPMGSYCIPTEYTRSLTERIQLLLLLFLYSFLFCIYGCFAPTYGPIPHEYNAHRGWKEASDPFKPELKRAVSHNVGAGSRIHVL